MRKKIAIAVLIVISFHSYCEELGLQDALRNAESKNRTIQSQKLEMKISDLEYIKSKKAFGLKLDLEAEENFILENKFNEDGVGPVTISLTQPIYTGGQLTGLLEQSRIDKEITDLEMVSLSLEVREQIIDSFFNILNLKKQVEISDRVIEILEKQRDRLEKLYTKGKLIPRSELLKVESDIITNKTDRIVKQKNIEVEKAALKVLMGVPFDSEFDLLEFDTGTLDVAGYEAKRDIEKALQRGSKATKEKLMVKRAENSVKLAKVDYYPTVSLGAEYAVKYNRIEGDNYQENWGLNLTANWNLFNWGITKDQVEQSVHRKDQAKIAYAENIDNIKLDITRKYTDMVTAHEKLEAQKSKLEITRANLRIDTLRYDNGIISSLDYLDSVNQLQDAEDSYYSLQRELVSAVDKYESSLK